MKILIVDDMKEALYMLETLLKEIGIRAFVMKPLVMRNLAETVRKVLD